MADYEPPNQEIFQLVQDWRNNFKYKYVVFKIENGLVVDVIGDERVTDEKEDDMASFEEMVSHCPSGESRYVLYRYGSKYNTNSQKAQLFFIFWHPNKGSVIQMMKYSSQYEKLLEDFKWRDRKWMVQEKEDLTYDKLSKEIQFR